MTIVQRPSDKPIDTDSNPFWPAGRAWVDVTITEEGGKITAKGVVGQNQIVFTAELVAGQETRFLDAVRVGTAGTEETEALPPSNDNQAANAGGEANTVIVTDPGPGDDGGSKKYRVALPLALQAAKRPTGT